MPIPILTGKAVGIPPRWYGLTSLRPHANGPNNVTSLTRHWYEVLFLTWEEVDLPNGFIRLKADITKTGVARSVPLHPRVIEALSCLPRGIRSSRVFLWKGKPINDFTFHDLRHCDINDFRVAGNDYLKIIAISGHKTMSVFKRYNLVTEDELRSIIWQDRPQ